MIALILVLVFMVAYYNNAGLVADIALFANVFFVMGILASLGAVLTLPGIAGIVLTIGMSVDANILIFERVREELTLGKGMRLAVSDGFKHAYSSIIDSNVTTLILGIILYISVQVNTRFRNYIDHRYPFVFILCDLYYPLDIRLDVR